jgi:hypothetical protein
MGREFGDTRGLSAEAYERVLVSTLRYKKDHNLRVTSLDKNTIQRFHTKMTFRPCLLALAGSAYRHIRIDANHRADAPQAAIVRFIF